MRYRDCPTIEVSQRMSGTVAEAWALVTDIAFPTYCTGELINVHWLDGADKVAVGARFKGTNGGDGSQWETISVITEVEPESRWVWNVLSEGARMRRVGVSRSSRQATESSSGSGDASAQALRD